MAKGAFRLLALAATILMLTEVSAQGNNIYPGIVHKYVKDGLVDYKGLKDDADFYVYLNSLVNINPQKFNRSEKLAFWINAYNAFTLKIVSDNYPVKSVRDISRHGVILSHILKTTVWDKEFINIDNKIYSLNVIEHKILRKMNEPRIHFAIVCASISCPTLRNQAYEADKINNQLDDQARLFINDTTKNSFNKTYRIAHLSKIFDWYEDDFGGTDENVLKYIANYLPKEIAEDIRDNSEKWEITYKDYNWNINEQK